MYGNSIESIRKIAFEEIKNNQTVYYKSLEKSLCIISDNLSDIIIGRICLNCYEFILYSYFSCDNKVHTKCEIDSELVRNRTTNGTIARTLLSNLYKVRNGFAHNDLQLSAYIEGLRDTIRGISSKTQFLAIIRLFIKSKVPKDIENLYYIVKRNEINPNLEKFEKQVWEVLYDNTVDECQRTIDTVRDKLYKYYDNDVVNALLVHMLKDNYIALGSNN